MSEREELARIVLSMDRMSAIDAILAAGYVKPRQVTTAEELDALPHAAVILDALNYCREAAKVSDGNLWRAMGPATVRASREISLPATILWEPQP